MRTRIIRIGNSQGVRIPRLLLEQAGLTGEVDLLVEGHQLAIRGVRHPRDGWDEAFRLMAERGDDRLEDDHACSSWDEQEWQW